GTPFEDAVPLLFDAGDRDEPEEVLDLGLVGNVLTEHRRHILEDDFFDDGLPRSPPRREHQHGLHEWNVALGRLGLERNTVRDDVDEGLCRLLRYVQARLNKVQGDLPAWNRVEA